MCLQQELLKEQQAYLAHLAQQLEEEKQREKHMDKLLDDEIAKVWAKKAEQMRLEKEARKQLLKDVLETRQLQLEEKCKYQQLAARVPNLPHECEPWQRRRERSTPGKTVWPSAPRLYGGGDNTTTVSESAAETPLLQAFRALIAHCYC